ncbi:glycine betaine/L-proline ABC transporter ATP-binding protein [Desulfovibrio sp. OttesenSCG-928-G15]|nr:glycine betaine/L-proline ABC transporter ATP-binding protein [Desulfovibrio sp. OttesenSCG-928-G15]
MAKIEVCGLVKIFGKRPAVALGMLAAGETRESVFKKNKHLVAVDSVSFSVDEGELLVVMGLSGSGKSTLLRCLNRLIEPTAGMVIIDGQDISRLSVKELRQLRQRKIGMVFQHFALLPHYTVLRNAAYGLELMQVPAAEREARAREALARVGLAGWENSMPHNLSGGMKQRVGLARALALDPQILLMDEAFSALDPLTRKEMQSELLRLQHELHKTIIFISHDLDEALTLGDRIILLREGRIVQEGTAEDILSNPADEYVAGFVRHADRGRVLTAGSIMVAPYSVAVLGLDGPLTALRKIRSDGLTCLFVLDAFHTLVGVVYEEDLEKLRGQGKRDLSLAMKTELITTSADTPLTDIIPVMANLQYPLPVVDERGRLMGIIVRGTLLQALAANEPEASEPEASEPGAAVPDAVLPDAPVSGVAVADLAGFAKSEDCITGSKTA